MSISNPTILICAENVYLRSPAQFGIPLPAAAAADTIKSEAPATEVKYLGGGKPILQSEMLEELAGLGTGWRLESPHELFALVDYDHKNQHGAYTRDESLKDGYHWTSRETPWCSGGRVVVGFGLGDVNDFGGGFRAFARAVRVSGQ